MRILPLRIALAVAYPLLAHWASHDGSGMAAAIALADLVLVVLIEPLAQLRPSAWAAFVALLAGLVLLAGTPHAQLALLAPPVLFIGLLSWVFGRTLRAGRVPLITRMVAGMEKCTPDQLSTDLRRYTRRLTGSWSAMLALLALVNAVLAVLAVPDGVLARLGQVPVGTTPWWAVPRDAWSWFANVLNYGLVFAFFFGEYLLRKRRFPDRPYRNFFGFLRSLAQLGPEFWRAALR